MTSSSAFAYTPITAPRTVRLLYLKPGSSGEPIKLSLTTISLNSAPEYEAISYCWGDASSQLEVDCDGTSISITTSLHTGLAHFRLPDRPRVLWADAVCINQAEPAEKSQQVPLMPSIYSQASRVLVWLGIADDPVHGSLPPNIAESIKQALALVPEFDFDDPADLAAKMHGLLDDAMQLRKAGRPNLMHHDWQPLAKLMARPWFRRKWIVQEVALSKETTLYAGGGVEIAWMDVAALAFRMEALGVALFAFEQLAEKHTGHQKLMTMGKALHCATVILACQYYKDPSTLLDAVLATSTFQCTDPRDHVYALLSLPSDSLNIKPDYESTDADVYRRFAVSTLVDGRSLKLLGLAPDKLLWTRPGTNRLEGLPSWVPDLRRLGEVDTLCSYTFRKQLFHAGGDGPPELSVSEDGFVLSCRGLVVDTVKSFATTIIDQVLADTPEQLEAPELIQDPSTERRERRTMTWLQSCYDVAFHDAQSPPNQESRRRFSRTMLCGMSGMRDVAPAELVDAFPEWLNYLTAQAAGGKTDKSPRLLQNAAAIEQSVMSIAPGRRFCVTEGGRYGHLPLTSRTGDIVCVLLGGEVPYVVRPTGLGTYTFVGECYLDGVMDGEALKMYGGRVDSFQTIKLE